jgi:hypothetical protein
MGSRTKKTPMRRGTLFGKPYSQVVKRPGAFRAKAKSAGISTAAYAQKMKSASGRTGKQARLALAFAKMRRGR